MDAKRLARKELLILVVVGISLAVLFGTSVAYAASTVHRNLAVDFVSAEPIMVVPEPDQTLTISVPGTGTFVYTVLSTSEETWQVDVGYDSTTIPSGVSVSVDPTTFTLTPGANREVTATITGDAAAQDCTISFSFTPSQV